jgi:hypothetical protein
MSGPVTSVRATVRAWRHGDRSWKAFERAGWVGYAPGEGPETMEAVTRVWLAGGCGREEVDGQVVVWRNGERYSEFEWLRTPLDDRALIEDSGLPAGDEIVIERDAERGTPLRIEARYAGEPYMILEVLEIAFDETFADDIFTPPPGEKDGQLSLEEVVAAAPFVLWVPANDWKATVAYAQMEEEPHLAPQVHLQYASEGLRIAQSPAGHPDAMNGVVFDGAGPWRELERGGRRMEVQEHLERRPGAQVRLDLEGTRVVVHSWNLDADGLADVAAGLRRAG